MTAQTLHTLDLSQVRTINLPQDLLILPAAVTTIILPIVAIKKWEEPARVSGTGLCRVGLACWSGYNRSSFRRDLDETLHLLTTNIRTFPLLKHLRLIGLPKKYAGTYLNRWVETLCQRAIRFDNEAGIEVKDRRRL